MQQIIGVVLGLASVFFVLSVFASHLQEMLSSYFTRRSMQLEIALKSMLLDPDIVARFFAHPLVQGLSTNPPRRSLFGTSKGSCRPSYVPSATFCKVLQSVLGTAYAPAATTLTDVIKAVPDSSLKRTLTTVLLGSTDNPSAVAAVQQWFDDTMTRLSGSYKRKTQSSLLVIGFVLAIAVNANIVHITSVLWSSSDARNRAETLADEYVHNPACKETESAAHADCGTTTWKELNQQLSFLPIGWTGEQATSWNDATAPLAALFQKDKEKSDAKNETSTDKSKSTDPGSALSKIPRATFLPLFITLFGWLGTAVGVSFGSAFWFDLINQVVNLRLSGPKPAPTSQPSA